MAQVAGNRLPLAFIGEMRSSLVSLRFSSIRNFGNGGFQFTDVILVRLHGFIPKATLVKFDIRMLNVLQYFFMRMPSAMIKNGETVCRGAISPENRQQV